MGGCLAKRICRCLGQKAHLLPAFLPEQPCVARALIQENGSRVVDWIIPQQKAGGFFVRHGSGSIGLWNKHHLISAVSPDVARSPGSATRRLTWGGFFLCGRLDTRNHKDGETGDHHFLHGALPWKCDPACWRGLEKGPKGHRIKPRPFFLSNRRIGLEGGGCFRTRHSRLSTDDCTKG